MARRSSILRVDFREAGREPMLRSAISAIGVAAKLVRDDLNRRIADDLANFRAHAPAEAAAL